MPDKSNDISARQTHATRKDFSREIPPSVIHGTPEELQRRVGGARSWLTDGPPSNYRQLGPGGAGGNVNDLKPKSYKGSAARSTSFRRQLTDE